MLIHDSCQSAIRACLDTGTFAVAWLYNNEKTMGIHMHDCYEIYFSISGGRQFLIDNRIYEVRPGDIFLINQCESHCLSHVDQMTHERVVISVFPEYLKGLSTKQTNLDYCFTYRNPVQGHRLSLTEEERARFLYFVHKLSEKQEFGQDVLDQAVFLELMTFLNHSFMVNCEQAPAFVLEETLSVRRPCHSQIEPILDYINQHLAENLSIPMLAAYFYFSSSYLSRIFKDATGTTINQYITARRIAKAKALLAQGHSVAETSLLCGFGDYSNFLKSFTKSEGISPKKYASLVRR